MRESLSAGTASDGGVHRKALRPFPHRARVWFHGDGLGRRDVDPQEVPRAGTRAAESDGITRPAMSRSPYAKAIGMTQSRCTRRPGACCGSRSEEAEIRGSARCPSSCTSSSESWPSTAETHRESGRNEVGRRDRASRATQPVPNYARRLRADSRPRSREFAPTHRGPQTVFVRRQ